MHTTSVSKMSPPTAIEVTPEESILDYAKKTTIRSTSVDPDFTSKLPASTRRRFDKYGIDLSEGYPKIPDRKEIPTFLDEAYAIRNKEVPYEDRGKFADPEKKALFGAATEVINLTKSVGTEIVGLQLSDLNDKQKDELALLAAERIVVFFRDQDLSPQKQLALGEYWGQVERHPQAGHVPLPRREGDEDWAHGSGITVIWKKYFSEYLNVKADFKTPGNDWHTDLVHEFQPSGISHLHVDTIPKIGGDTAWSSGYGAYDKLSPALQQFLDGKTAIHRSAHEYLDRENPLKGPKPIEREFPLVRTHPVTGWKSLFLNRKFTTRIVGLEPAESKLILNYLLSVFEDNLDIQVRFTWQPTKEGFGTSVIWDNRVSEHIAITDYDVETDERHATRVVTLGEVPFFDSKSKSQRESLGLSLD